MTTVAETLSRAIPQLEQAGVDSPRLDAELLLAFVLGRNRGWLWMYPEYQLSARQQQAFDGLLARRIKREPLAYLLGEWEFYGLPFSIRPGVLVPRPETELLVEAVIYWAKHHQVKELIDVGTGSGAIAVTLACQLQKVHITAVDISQEALRVTKTNVDRHGVSQQVRLIEGDLLLPIMQEHQIDIDVVVANLPYIPEDEVPSLMPEVRDYEPYVALAAKERGLALIYRLISESMSVLRPGGLIALEVGIKQASIVAEYLGHHGWHEVRIIDDYAGIPRHVLAEYCPITHG